MPILLIPLLVIVIVKEKAYERTELSIKYINFFNSNSEIAKIVKKLNLSSAIKSQLNTFEIETSKKQITAQTDSKLTPAASGTVDKIDLEWFAALPPNLQQEYRDEALNFEFNEAFSGNFI